LAKRLWFFYQN